MHLFLLNIFEYYMGPGHGRDCMAVDLHLPMQIINEMMMKSALY